MWEVDLAFFSDIFADIISGDHIFLSLDVVIPRIAENIVINALADTSI